MRALLTQPWTAAALAALLASRLWAQAADPSGPLQTPARFVDAVSEEELDPAAAVSAQLGVTPVKLPVPAAEDPVAEALAAVAGPPGPGAPPAAVDVLGEPGARPPIEEPPAEFAFRELDALAIPEAELFREVLALVEAHYVDPSASREQLFLGAAEGLLRRLGPPGAPEANELIDADAYGAMKRALTGGEMVGIGVLIDNRRAPRASPTERAPLSVRVAAVMPGSPAARAGIRAGDRIVWVDGQPAVRPDGRPDMARLRGAPGTRVLLTIQRGEQAVDVTVTREPLRMAFHSTQVLAGGVGHLRINLFNRETGAAVRAEVERLKTAGATALVLDLRGCEGGALEGALEVARAFLPPGKTVAILRRRGAAEERHTSEGPDLFPGPMAVLVDAETKGAAELVAAALRDNQKAILLGQRTYGKATSESIFELVGGRALKLTTAAYHSPSGRSWHGEGIAPDVLVENGTSGDAQLEAARRILAYRR